MGFLQAVDGCYVWMIERSERTCFTAKARQTLRVPREFGGQGFDSDLAVKLTVISAIDFAHATGAKGRHDSIRSKLPTRWDSRASRLTKCRCLQEIFCLFFLGQQRFDLTAQVNVLATGRIKECLPLLRLTRQNRVEKLRYSPPTFRIHRDSAPAVSQCYSTLLRMVSARGADSFGIASQSHLVRQRSAGAKNEGQSPINPLAGDRILRQGGSTTSNTTPAPFLRLKCVCEAFSPKLLAR